MFYYFLHKYSKVFTVLNTFNYITYRTIYAMLTTLFFIFIFGKLIINYLQTLQFEQPIRKLGPNSHQIKQGTPTMGGILILFVIILSVLFWINITNNCIWYVLFALISFGLIGFIDDYKKVIMHNTKGISLKIRIIAEVIISFLISFLIFLKPPFIVVNKIFHFIPSILNNSDWLYICFSVFVIVGTANAVNLTDGLDGLSIGLLIICFTGYLFLTYFSGNILISNFLKIPYIPGAGELSVLCGIILGSGIGFLWFNSYPAQIFMGDVGSLSLGAALGTLAILIKQEFFLSIIGGIFILETFSVIIQIFWFKITKGKRILLMAPIHHHYELKGIKEPKIIIRFWIINIILTIIAFTII